MINNREIAIDYVGSHKCSDESCSLVDRVQEALDSRDAEWEAKVDKLSKALEWYVNENERAVRKGYDLTEILLERCLENAKLALAEVRGEGS